MAYMVNTTSGVDTIFPELHGHDYALLTTFRKNGTAIPTPIWFAIADDRLYILTMNNSGKVKRIRHTPAVELAACNRDGTKILGPTVHGVARILPVEETTPAKIALNRKYGILKSAFDLMMAVTGKVKDRVYLEIVPAPATHR